MSHSFISPKFYDMIGWDENDPRRISTTILNPLGEDFQRNAHHRSAVHAG